MSNIGIILLAAGGSTRMGQPKQFPHYQGRTLLRRAVEAGKQSGCEPLIVVVGHHVDQAVQDLAGIAEAIIEPNPDWQRGMGTSLRTGLRRLLAESPHAAGAIIVLCDQPHVQAKHVRQLCEVHVATGKGVIASEYGQTLGPPCLFAATWFDRLLAIADDEGAKRLILKAADDRAIVPLPEGGVDIDTPGDYETLASH